MRVLLLSQHYAPETGAPPNRMRSIVRGLRAEGHEVAVVTAVPNHPEGEVYEGYRKRLFVHEDRDGVNVVRTWVYTSPQRGFTRRLANYLSFMVMSIWGAMRHHGRFDVVIASSPPLFVGLAGWIISLFKRSKFVFDVRDLWPEVAIAMGELQNPVAIGAARTLERFLYARADGVTAVTESFCRFIQSSNKRPVLVARVMNGTDPEVFRRDEAGLWMRKHLDLETRFLVGYVGNLGLAQGLDHVLDAAAWLRKREPNALFLLVGSGPVKERLMEAARARNLYNVLFFPRVTQDEAAVWMSACDALLVPLGRHRIYESFIPSKLFDSMASGRPVLLSVPGEAASVLGRAGAGMNYVPEDGAGLAECVQLLVNDPLTGDEMGARGRAYASEVLTRDAQAQLLVQFLEHLHGQTMVVDEFYGAEDPAAPLPRRERRARNKRNRTRIQR